MVLLGADSSVKDYLESQDVLPTLQAAVEAMLKKYSEDPPPDESPPNPLGFLAEWLKRNNPKHNAEFAAEINKMRETPGYGSKDYLAAAIEAAPAADDKE